MKPRTLALALILVSVTASSTACSSEVATEPVAATSAALNIPELCQAKLASYFNTDANPTTTRVFDWTLSDDGDYFGMGDYNGPNGLRANWSANCIIHETGGEAGGPWAEVSDPILF